MNARRALAVVVVIAIVAALASIVPVRVEAPATESPRSNDVADPNVVTARVRVVGIDGLPIAGMIPIATTEANAFNAPVAQGAPTDADGKSVLRLPPERYLYVRAWDPELDYFANNFFDVPESPGGSETALMGIVMARAAALTATILQDDSTPLVDASVAIMMNHPERGPWWPAQGRTGEDGALIVPSVPPGVYHLHLSAENFAATIIKGVTLRPGATVHLGTIVLGELPGQSF